MSQLADHMSITFTLSKGQEIRPFSFANSQARRDINLADAGMVSSVCCIINDLVKIGYSRICACTKIPVFCLPPGPADENKGSRPSLIALQTELLLLYLNGVGRSELVAPNSNFSSSGAD